MSTLGPEEALDVALDAARAAGRILVDRFGGPAAGVRSKSSATDLVSEADERAEHTIVGYLRARRPDDAIVAEEGSSASGSTGVRWLVDPLDGTINFLYGIPHWSVAICCADAQGPLTGVVYEPLRDEVFLATRGGGAFVGEARLRVTAKAELASALVATGFAYDSEERRRQGAIVARLVGEVRDVRRAGAATLDLAYVAAGRLDGYFEAVHKPWDWMAGALLVREAGGRVTDLAPRDLALPNIVASGPAIHDALIALVTRSVD